MLTTDSLTFRMAGFRLQLRVRRATVVSMP